MCGKRNMRNEMRSQDDFYWSHRRQFLMNFLMLSRGSSFYASLCIRCSFLFVFIWTAKLSANTWWPFSLTIEGAFGKTCSKWRVSKIFNILHHLWIHNETSPNLACHSSFGRALQQYRKGYGFESLSSLIFFSKLYFRNCLSWLHNCDDLSCLKIFQWELTVKNRTIASLVPRVSLLLGGRKDGDPGNGYGQLLLTQSRIASYQHLRPDTSLVKHFQMPSKHSNFS